MSLELTTPLELTAISSQVASQLSALEADIASDNTQSSCQILVTRQTLDVAGLKVEFPLAQTPKTKIVKHYLFKAGIGAHLNNATTGFSIESWLESPEKPLPKSYIASIVCLTLPAAAVATTSARLLSAFGGTSDKAISLTEAKLFRNQDSEGGLHGLRVIDGIDGLFVDIRSAKPLDACLIEPLERDPLNPELFGGLRISFILAAQRIFEDIKSNTVFFSIR